MKAIYIFLVRGLMIFGGAMFISANANGQGQVVGWGDSSKGQTMPSSSILPFQDASAGFAHTVAIRVDGSVMAWGYNSSGQTTVPENLDFIFKVAAGGYHTMALSIYGKVTAWGSNTYGQCPGIPADY